MTLITLSTGSLERLRRLSGLSTAEIARRTDIPYMTLRRFFWPPSDRRGRLTREEIERLVAVLQREVDGLQSSEPPAEPDITPPAGG